MKVASHWATSIALSERLISEPITAIFPRRLTHQLLTSTLVSVGRGDLYLRSHLAVTAR